MTTTLQHYYMVSRWIATELFRMPKYVDFYYQLQDQRLQQAYTQFHQRQESALYPLVVGIACFVSLVAVIGVNSEPDTSPATKVFNSLFSISVFATGVVGFAMVVLHLLIQQVRSHSKYDPLVMVSTSVADANSVDAVDNLTGHFSRLMNPSDIVSLQRYEHYLSKLNLLYVMVTCAMALTNAARRATSTMCTLPLKTVFEKILHYYFCGNLGDSILGYDVVLFLYVVPVAMATILPSVNVRWIWLVVVVSMTEFVILSIIQNEIPSFLFLLIWVVTHVFTIATKQNNKIKSFYLYIQLQELLQEREKMAKAFHVNEMRHLIANVAHDLKSPLMSFTSAVDLMIQCSADMETVLHRPEVVAADKVDKLPVAECLDTMHNCLQSLQDTNVFMLMTINRSIDYAKAAKGLTLVPHIETISLLKAIELPLNCTRNIQNRVEVILNPVPDAICRKILTDKQWLQENLLCLLSNAVKYSHAGTVTLSLTLIPDALSIHSRSAESSSTSLVDGEVCHPRPPVAPGVSDPTSTSSSLQLPLPSPLPLTQEAAEYDDNMSESSSSSSSSLSFLPPVGLQQPDNQSVVSQQRQQQQQQQQQKQKQRLLLIRSTSSHADARAQILFEVEDCGIGVPKGALKELFRPFKQTQRLTGGTGLGLYSLAKRLDAIGGHYGVRDRDNGQQGSIFWFSIPYRPDVLSLMSESDDDLQGSTTMRSRWGLTRRDSLFPMPRSSTHQKFPFDVAVPPAPLDGSSLTATTTQSVQDANQPTKELSSTMSSTATLSVTSTFPTVYSHSSTYTTDTCVDDTDKEQKSKNIGMNTDGQMGGSPPSDKVPSSRAGTTPTTPTLSAQSESGSVHESALTHRASRHTLGRPLSMAHLTTSLDVLLVDDSLAIVKLTSMMLRKLGHRITTAENGEVAVREVSALWMDKGKSFDVILMDLQMPVMDGLEATKRIRSMEGHVRSHANPFSMEQSGSSHSSTDEEEKKRSDEDTWDDVFPRQYIVCVSANSDHSTEIAALECGADVFVAKPFTVESILLTNKFNECQTQHQRRNSGSKV